MERIENANTPYWTLENSQPNRWSTTQKILIVAQAVAFIGMAAMMSINLYTRNQNGKIEKLDCHIGETVDGIVRDVIYYKNAVEQQGLATDQYCFAELLEKGIGTEKSLSEARHLYKQAYDQGLPIAKERLCRPDMFERKWGNFQEYNRFQDIFVEYAQFKSICCPSPQPGTVCAIPTCPWQEEYSPNQSC